ncbi:MAG: hypothetical protein Q9207_003092 [Kuettlingeria erythrocarpa]
MSPPQPASSNNIACQPRGVDELPQQDHGRHECVALSGLLVEKARGPLPDDKHIRLLQISSSAIEQGALRLEFIEVRLDEAPAYKALSYTWGPPSTAPCLENLEGYRMTPNLTACLSELVDRLPGLWWIDALCINQDDPDEKSHQVKMMRSIYASAQKVYVWLGPDGDDGQSAVELLYELDRIKSEGIIVPGKFDIDFRDEDLGKIGLPRTDSSAWRALVSLTSRAYFQRMWVVQELAAAPQDISVLCGDIVFSWWLLSTSLNLIQNQRWEYPLLDLLIDHGISTEPPAFVLNNTIALLRFQTQEFGLTACLGFCRSFSSTDPRDKIIALLGLIPPREQAIKELQPNYSQPAAQYFREVAGALIMHDRSYNVLLQVETRAAASKPELPSWVPDYTTNYLNNYQQVDYDAIPSNQFSGQWTSGSNTLHVHAKLVDEVDLVSPVAFASTLSSTFNDTVWSWLLLAAEAAGKDVWRWLTDATNPEAPASTTALDTFWRTLIRDTAEYPDNESPGALDGYLWLFLGCLIGLLHKQDNEKTRDLLALWVTGMDFERLILKPMQERRHLAYCRQFLVSAEGNTFFTTKAGRMGLGPWTIRPKDKVALFSGGDFTFFVRPGRPSYGFVGHGYVHDLMNGAALEEGRPFEQINLQ